MIEREIPQVTAADLAAYQDALAALDGTQGIRAALVACTDTLTDAQLLALLGWGAVGVRCALNALIAHGEKQNGGAAC